MGISKEYVKVKRKIHEKICRKCNKEFLGVMNQLRCDDCNLEKITFSKFKQNGITTGTVGAISELKASVDLMSRGFHVFRALSPSCPCDLFAIKNFKQFAIEVRTAYRSENGSIYKNKAKSDIKNNIMDKYFAWVMKDEIVYEPELE